MVRVGSFDTTSIQTLVSQLLDAELPAAPQLFQTPEESLTYLRRTSRRSRCYKKQCASTNDLILN